MIRRVSSAVLVSSRTRGPAWRSRIDFTPAELRFLLRLARALKMAKYVGTEAQRLQGKEIALIFEKTSTRTRCAFEVASYDEART